MYVYIYKRREIARKASKKVLNCDFYTILGGTKVILKILALKER